MGVLIGDVIGYTLMIGFFVLVGIGVWRKIFERVNVLEFQRAVHFRSGRLRRVLEPGSHWIRRGPNNIVFVDTRPVRIGPTSHEAVTADDVNVRLSVVTQYRVVEPAVAIAQAGNYADEMYSLVHVALVRVVGRMTGAEVSARRGDVGGDVQEYAADTSRAIGLELVSVDTGLLAPVGTSSRPAGFSAVGLREEVFAP
jgi:regulator of protease activity HflC (stomatin/prohibitin superfamily)